MNLVPADAVTLVRTLLDGAARLPRTLLPVAALLVVLCFVALTRADPDLWGHVRFGQDMIAAGSVGVPDVYSFTSDRPWINHEWLAEILMAVAYDLGGAAGLVLLKLTTIGLSIWCVWSIVRNDGGSRRAAIILCAIALAGLLPRAQMVRPQMFSVLCFAVLVLLLRMAEKRPHWLWAAPAVFAAWANMHGGWMVGAGTFVAWNAARTATGAWESRRDLLLSWGACLLAIAATLCTPYGVNLWVFLRDTVGSSRRFIAEWGSVTSAPNLVVAWLGFWILIALALRRASGLTTLRSAVVPVLWGIASFKVSRLDAFFALSTVAFLTPALLTMIERRSSRPRPEPAIVWRVALALVGAAACSAAAVQFARNVSCIDVHATTMPEPDAMAFIRDHRLSGRMVTFFDWGEYIIWHKPDGLRVSMDGRRETVYSEASVDRHLDMYLGTEGSSAYLWSLHPDYIWVPNRLPFATRLLTSPEWKPLFRGMLSTVFARGDRAGNIAVVRDEGAVDCRCFPGP